MTYFQNVLEQEFRANWVLGDRTYVIEFVDPANFNKSNYQFAWNPEPYNLSVNNTLTLYYAWDINFMNYSSLSINVAGATPAATMAAEVAAALNANPIFAEMFQAQISPQPNGPAVPVNELPFTGPAPYNSILIVPKVGRVKQNIRLWIDNGGAQQAIGFNKKAAIAEMPLYMARHTIANRFAFPDSQACLVQLSQRITAISVAGSAQITVANHGFSTGNQVYIGGSNSTPSIDGGPYTITVVDANNFTIPVTTTGAGDRGEVLNPVQYFMVTQFGYNISQVQSDWQLLRGRTGLFTFQNQTVDGSDRITQIIQYPAGAQVGDFAKKIQYTYSGSNQQPSQITEIPYTLTSADLITPP